MLEFQKIIIHKIIPKERIVYLDIYRYNYEITNSYVGDYLSSHDLPNILLGKFKIM